MLIARLVLFGSILLGHLCAYMLNYSYTRTVSGIYLTPTHNFTWQFNEGQFVLLDGWLLDPTSQWLSADVRSASATLNTGNQTSYKAVISTGKDPARIHYCLGPLSNGRGRNLGERWGFYSRLSTPDLSEKINSTTASHRITQFPLWALVGLFFSLACGIALLTRKMHSKPGVCVKCGYDLRMHKAGEKCPECGAVVRVPSL